MEYERVNRETWDRLARGSAFAKPATDAEVAQPLAALDSRGWLPGRVDGLRVLCLAAGGGWQSILYAAAGAKVTVVDLSPEMLAVDHRESDRRGYSMDIVECSMTEVPLPDESFDLVHQPVSTCYVPNVIDVYTEVARLLTDGGLYISQHKTPTSLQVATHDAHGRYVLGAEQFGLGPLPVFRDTTYREPDAAEYLHVDHDLIGGLCRSGFVLEDLVEPRRIDQHARPGEIGHRGRFVSPYVRLKARRVKSPERPENQPAIWTPDSV